MIVYAVVFCVGALYILRLVALGPRYIAKDDGVVAGAPGSALGAAPKGGEA
jgi:hypothetical protein